MPTPYRAETLSELRDDARELLRGAIDAHAHWAPDPFAERKSDARALAPGVVFKRVEVYSGFILTQRFCQLTRLVGCLCLMKNGLNRHGIGSKLRVIT